MNVNLLWSRRWPEKLDGAVKARQILGTGEHDKGGKGRNKIALAFLFVLAQVLRDRDPEENLSVMLENYLLIYGQ
jgi:hypothetical protein